MDSLRRVQTGMNVMRIISLVIFIIMCVAFGIMLISTIFLTSGVINLDDIRKVADFGAISGEQVVGACVSAVAELFFTGITFYFIYRYFVFELKEGTPFTKLGAKKILNLGVIMIALGLISAVVNEIVKSIFAISALTGDIGTGSIGTGICVLLLSFVASYGADLRKMKENEDSQK